MKMKRHFVFLLLFILCFVPKLAFCGITFDIKFGGSAMTKLSNNVTEMTKQINSGSSQMMKIGSMVICSSLHGKAADLTFSFMGMDFNFRIIAPLLWLSGFTLYILGFFVMLIASFYMFDVAFNLAIFIALLPLSLALWPFAWTKDKFKTVISNIVYYVGIFIFLPLGILIAKQLVVTIMEHAFADEGVDFATAFAEDNSDVLEDNLGLFSFTFIKILVSYIVAIRVIPLLAKDFCNHFFGSALGSPISEKLSQLIATTKKHSLDKIRDYGFNVIGNGAKNAGTKTGQGIRHVGQKTKQGAVAAWRRAGRAVSSIGNWLHN
jgi:hypothetical protein